MRPEISSDGAVRFVAQSTADDSVNPAQRESADPSSDELVAVVGTTFAGIVTLWSPGAQRMFGWSEEEAIGRRAKELADWGLTQDDFAEFIFVGSSGAWIREHEVTTRTGARIKLKTTASLVVGQDGMDEVIASLLPIQPGSDGSPPVVRGRPFRAITERGSDLVIITDRNVIISYVGPSLHQMFGYRPREVVGVAGWKFVHPEEVVRLRREWAEAIANPGEHRELELRVRDASGSWRWVELRISNMVADLAVSAMVLNLRDVTDYREMAERLAVNGRLLQAVMDAATEGIWVTDPDGGTVFANDRMAELLAVDQARLAGGTILDFFDPTAGELVQQQMNRRAVGVRERSEFSFIRLDGQRRWFRSSGIPIYDEAGHYAGSVGLVTDITDFKLLEHELEKRGIGDGAHPGGRDNASRQPEDDSYVATLVADYLRNARTEPTEPVRNAEEAVPGLDRLSRRELEVVRMLLLGDRVPVIARHLFVSQSTVRNHLSSVFRKLRVRSQQELIVLLRERNLGG